MFALVNPVNFHRQGGFGPCPTMKNKRESVTDSTTDPASRASDCRPQTEKPAPVTARRIMGMIDLDDPFNGRKPTFTRLWQLRQQWQADGMHHEEARRLFDKIAKRYRLKPPNQKQTRRNLALIEHNQRRSGTRQALGTGRTRVGRPTEFRTVSERSLAMFAKLPIDGLKRLKRAGSTMYAHLREQFIMSRMTPGERRAPHDRSLPAQLGGTCAQNITVCV